MKWITIENGETYLHILTKNGKYVKISVNELKNILAKLMDNQICDSICYPKVEEIVNGYADRYNYASSSCRDIAQDCIDKIYQYILTQI